MVLLRHLAAPFNTVPLHYVYFDAIFLGYLVLGRFHVCSDVTTSHHDDCALNTTFINLLVKEMFKQILKFRYTCMSTKIYFHVKEVHNKNIVLPFLFLLKHGISYGI